MMDKTNILAPAKINIFLKVLGKREDGFHDIRSGVTFINLYDEIQIKKSKRLNIKYMGLFKPSTGNYQDCIILKTLKFLNLESKINLDITIKKNIPVQGGLGSASTNAASLIKGLSNMKIIEIGEIDKYVNLGSDVPSFLYEKNCLVLGKGEKLFFQNIPKYFFLLIKPQFSNSTKYMYHQVDFSRNNLNQNILIDDKIFNEEDAGNDFEKIIYSNNKQFKQIYNFLNSIENVIFTRMTGSGSCCYSVFEKKEYAIKAREIFKSQYKNLWTCVCENNI